MAKKPPAELAALQAAFGRSISTPLQFLDDEGNYALLVDRYDPIAIAAVCPRGDQGPAERIGVYNQQYWFRLLTVMQEEFPLTEALMGIQEFNRLAMAYMDAMPPDSVRLRDLSNRLPAFAASFGVEPTVGSSIALERVYIESFDAATLPAPSTDTPDQAQRLATEPLLFQPHFALLELQHNVVDLRRRVKAGEGVTAADVESAPAWWAFWRGRGIQSVELGPLQAQLLRRVVAGEPLGAACEALAETLDAEQVEFLIAHVQRWFAAWATAGWFAADGDL